MSVTLFTVLAAGPTPVQLACLPDQLTELMAQEFPERQYTRSGSTITLVLEKPPMTPEEITALSSLGPVVIEGESYTLCHVGGPTTKRTKKKIFVEAAPTRGWSAGQPIPDKALRRWLREPGSLIDANKTLMVRANKAQIYVFGTWKPEMAALINKMIAAERAGGFNPYAYGFQQFSDAVDELKGAELRRLKNRVRAMEKEVAETTSKLTAMIRDLRGMQRLAQVQDAPSDVRGILQRTATIKGVAGMRLEGTTLILSTMPITIRNRKKHYDIGRFDVSINVATADIHFKNLTRTINGNHHPHIFSNNSACLGEITRVVPRLLGDFMLPELVAVLIRYLRSVNHRDSAGRHIVDWPLVVEPAVPAAEAAA